MRESFLDLLVCPRCRGGLDLRSARRGAPDEIDTGQLHCAACEASYPISGGIPRLLDQHGRDETRRPRWPPRGLKRTAATFGYEFSRFEQPPHYENELTFFRKTGIDPALYSAIAKLPRADTLSMMDDGYRPRGDFLHGKRVLEVGCEMGRFMAVACDHAREVIGIDISSSVDVARKLYGHLPNIHLVQGDILHAPLREEAFDFVYSIGVLHHTPDTYAAFREAAKLCKPRGDFAVWVYPPSYWSDPIRGTVAKTLRLLTRRLSPRLLHVFCSFLYPLGKLQVALAENTWTKLLGSPFFLIPVPRDQERHSVDMGVIYDYYSPYYIWTHTSEEVFDWFCLGGFKDIRILPVATAVTGRKRGPDCGGVPGQEPTEANCVK